MSDPSKSLGLREQAEEILKIAAQHGVEQNFFFITTFKRYQVQINILTDLEKTIRSEGTLVTKEYIKGRGNVYTHPAIAEYNRTSTAANQTVTTLMKIITTLRDEQDAGADELMNFLRGGKNAD
ncbi:MAG TPA: hypothetical protein PKZ39_05095 [Clostridia bacterium]|nr:hypothetical protein [Clostridia bacterium]